MKGLVSFLGMLRPFQLCDRTDGLCLNCLHTYSYWKITSVNGFTSHIISKHPIHCFQKLTWTLHITSQHCLPLAQALPKTPSLHHNLCCICCLNSFDQSAHTSAWLAFCSHIMAWTASALLHKPIPSSRSISKSNGVWECNWAHCCQMIYLLSKIPISST